MAKLYVDTIEPEGATTNLAIGEAGQDVILPGNDIRANVLQDAGGNAIFTSNGSGTLSGVSGGFGGAIALISSTTADDDAAVSFTSGFSTAYKHYIFKLYNINPATDETNFTFQTSTDGGSNYNVTLTSTNFMAYHDEINSSEAVEYNAAGDESQGTVYQRIAERVSNDADASATGEVHLFNPTSTTYVKNFYSTVNLLHTSGDSPPRPYSMEMFVSGYFNTTSAINAIQFKFSSGNINEGTIKMLGVKQ